MKYKVLSALLATSNAIGIGGSQKNEHLEATTILNNAVEMVEETALNALSSQELTNNKYVKELMRRVRALDNEIDHVN